MKGLQRRNAPESRHFSFPGRPERRTAKRVACAVLASGGIDSAVLLQWASRRYETVIPLFISSGLRWEPHELAALKAFLAAARLKNVERVQVLRVDCRELYKGHWSLANKKQVPGSRAAWSSVYLPGRNLLLLSKAAVFCANRGFGVVATGLLRGNPFRDARKDFLRALERSAGLALGRRMRFLAPWRRWEKAHVLRIGRALPLERTLSCLVPTGGVHCGRCTKCFERKRGFKHARVEDKTPYRA